MNGDEIDKGVNFFWEWVLFDDGLFGLLAGASVIGESGIRSRSEALNKGLNRARSAFFMELP
jgi:hypothetical protein